MIPGPCGYRPDDKQKLYLRMSELSDRDLGSVRGLYLETECCQRRWTWDQSTIRVAPVPVAGQSLGAAESGYTNRALSNKLQASGDSTANSTRGRVEEPGAASNKLDR